MHTHLERRAFTPSFTFTRRYTPPPSTLVPWPELEAWIPPRVERVVQVLKRAYPPERRRFLRIAHRGSSAHAPENTLAALRTAARLGADMVELDVRLAADGEAVVIHDADLRRLAGVPALVRDLTADALRRLRVLGSQQGIPSLREALEVCRTLHLGVYLDLKEEEAVAPVLRLVAEGELWRWAILGSPDPRLVARIRAAEPRVATALMVPSPRPGSTTPADALGVTRQATERAREAKARFLHLCWEAASPAPHLLLTPALLAQVRNAGLGLLAWHEERTEVLDGLRALGLDGLFSDRPELLPPASPET